MRNFSASSFLIALLLTSSLAKADYPDCFSTPPTPTEVSGWRVSAVAALPNGGTTVARNIKTCFGDSVPSCLKRVYSYGGRDDIAGANEDASYADAPERQPPAELFAPTATPFQYFIKPDVEAVANANQWPVVRYKSRHSGGFDSETASLLMVYIPGDKVVPPVNFDRWVNFALPADGAPDALTPSPQRPVPTEADFTASPTAFPRTFTMVSLTRATSTTQAEVYFQMFNRSGNTGVYTPSGNSGVTGCISCHPNGLRAISPLGFHVRAGEAQLPTEAWLATKRMNEAMDGSAGGKLVSWRAGKPDAAGVRKPFLKPEASWPIVGAIRPMNGISRTQAFIMGGTLPDGTTTPGCYKSRPTVNVLDIFGRPPGKNSVYSLSSTPLKNWTKVRTAMACETCHNNRQRYAITSTTDAATVDYKILVDQSMPPNAHQDPLDFADPTAQPFDTLSLDERISLANCLRAELALERPLLSKWLTQEVCQ